MKEGDTCLTPFCTTIWNVVNGCRHIDNAILAHHYLLICDSYDHSA
jgi:hypothetical protein